MKRLCKNYNQRKNNDNTYPNNYTPIMSNSPPTIDEPTKTCSTSSAIPIRVTSFFFLGTCAWSLVNAIFAELPLILGWNGDWSLASSISLCIALSNVLPILWSIIADARNGKPLISTSTGIGCLLVFGLAIALVFCLADIPTITQESPKLLLTLSTCSGVVGVMSLVLFFPHAYESSRLDQGWSITSLGTGTAIANFFLAAMAMVQGPGLATPKFSMSAYFGICVAFFGTAILGWIGTILYKAEPTKSNEAVETAIDVEEAKETVEPDIDDDKTNFQFAFWKVLLPIATDPRFREANLVQLILNAITFFLPGVAPFSVAHFPNPQLALQYLTISQLVAQTIGIAMTGIQSLRSERLTALLIASILAWIPTVVLSVVNQTDSFHSLQEHAAVPIAFNFVFNLLYGYVSTTCFQVVGSRCKDGENGEHITRVLGFLNQVGSMTGSIVGYLSVTKGGLS